MCSVLSECDTYFVLTVELSVGFCCVVCSRYQNKHGYNCSWFVYTPLSSWMCSWANAGARTHTNLKTTHIFNAQWLIKMLFPNSIENHFFNYNQNFFVQFNLKSFFFARSLLPILLRLRASSHRFGIVILWFGVSLSQFNLLSICLCRFDVFPLLFVFLFGYVWPFFCFILFLVCSCSYLRLYSFSRFREVFDENM